MSGGFPTTETLRLTQAVAAVGLTGSSLSLPDHEVDPAAWLDLVTAIQLHRLTGHLAAAVHDGGLPVTSDQADEVMRLHAEMMGICLRLESDLLAVTELLEGAGVPTIVLKGPSFAHLDYPDPSLRFFGDIDLLVRSDDFDLAASLIAQRGSRRHYPEIRRGFDRRFGKGASFTSRAGREIDLHRTFVMGPFGLRIDLASLWDGAHEQFSIGDRTLLALDREQRFLHACYHAALGKREPQLVPLRDLVVMLQRTDPELDLDRCHSIARAWGGEVVVARAVNAAWAAFALPDDAVSRWAKAYVPSRRDSRELRTYLDPRMGYAARSLAAVGAVPGTLQKVRFAGALAFPGRAYGAGRHRGRIRRLGSAVGELAQMWRRAS